ncbi:Part of AAA domain-containing protein [Paenibacillus sp. GP183]|nr:Part of AAA domain-containing protein [Paenibacillus sp. GP183]
MESLQLTAKQQECVDYKGEHLLVRGVAGSGKTTVLLKRARKHLEESKGAKIQLFTFNRTLAKYARSLASYIDPHAIKADHFHGWAKPVLQSLNIQIRHVKYPKKVIKDCLEALEKAKPYRLYKESTKFWEEEFSWMKGRQLLTLEDYLKADRKGRGASVRVTMEDRPYIFQAFEKYQQKLKSMKAVDFDDYALLLLQNFDRIPKGAFMDHILIDEAQDLHEAQMKIMRKLSLKSMTIAADKAQKIYKTTFAWKDIGINIRGKGSKFLNNSFRSTKQIIELARSIQQSDPLFDENDEEYLPSVTPDVEGTIPSVFYLKDRLHEDEFVVELIKKSIEEDNEQTIGLLSRFWEDLNRFQEELQKHGIESEIIRDEEGDVLTPGVKLTTFHSAKGLEFDTVILTRLENKILPYISRRQELDDEYLSTERKLFYVSMTRAKHLLYMTCGGREPSPFFDQMNRNLYRLKRLEKL